MGRKSNLGTTGLPKRRRTGNPMTPCPHRCALGCQRRRCLGPRPRANESCGVHKRVEKALTQCCSGLNAPSKKHSPAIAAVLVAVIVRFEHAKQRDADQSNVETALRVMLIRSLRDNPET